MDMHQSSSNIGTSGQHYFLGNAWRNEHEDGVGDSNDVSELTQNTDMVMSGGPMTLLRRKG